MKKWIKLEKEDFKSQIKALQQLYGDTPCEGINVDIKPRLELENCDNGHYKEGLKVNGEES
jgi:hypothetical protein